MARIVVLGASGFLGSHLCDELIARGDEVDVIEAFLRQAIDALLK